MDEERKKFVSLSPLVDGVLDRCESVKQTVGAS